MSLLSIWRASRAFGGSFKLVRDRQKVFETTDFPFVERICIDRPEMRIFVENNAPSSRFVACDFDRALTEQLHSDVFSGSMVVCSGVLENLADPERLARELASLRARCPWMLLATPDPERVRGLLNQSPPVNCVHITEWTAEEFGRFLVGCGFSRNLLIGYTVDNVENRAKNTVLVVAGNQAEPVESSRHLKIASIINMFNEADIIEPVVKHLVQQGVDVHLMDNWSTDGTYEIGQDLLAKGLCSRLQRFPDRPCSDYEWALQLDHTAQYAASLDADWIIHHDADEIRLSPWPGLSLGQAIEYVDSLGYTAIDFTVINFLYTDHENASKFDPTQIRSFTWGRELADFIQVKAWKNLSRVDLATSGGHDAQFDGRRIYPIKFLNKHYPLRSSLQANRKIFRERLPRIDKERRDRQWHIQYDAFRFVEEIRPWRSFELENFDRNIFNAEYLVERISGIGIEREPKIIPSLDTILSQMERLKSELETVACRKEEVENKLELQARQLEAHHRAVLEAHHRVVEVQQGRAANLEAELKNTVAEADDLRAELTDAHQRVVTLRTSLESVKLSTSWRFTLPLRWFAQQFPWSARQLKRGLRFPETLTFQLRYRIRRARNAKLLASSGLFDRDWYLDQYPDVRVAGIDPVKHYLAFGASEGRNPSPLFDCHWYLQQNPDVRSDGTNPLVHYLAHGAAEGRHPSPVLGGGVGAAGGGHHGSAVGDAGEPLDGVETELGGQNAKLLASSRLFDRDWYLDQYPDVRVAGVDPVKHYLAFGASEGRNPGPLFDSQWYLQQNPDVRNDGTNPLVHYLAHGAAEGRHPSPSSMLTSSKLSDRESFLSQGGADRVVPGGGVGAPGGGHHGSAVGDAGEPLDGVEAELGGHNAKLLASSRFFDRDWYLDQYPDVRVAGSDPVKHYLAFGASEGRNPGPLFDSHWYLQQNPDVRNDGTNPLVHYLAHGAAEGRHPSPSSMLTSSKSSDRESFLSQGGADRVVPGGGVGAAGGGHHGSAVGDAGEPLDGVEAELGGQNAKLLASSRFFDRDWYLDQYPDVRVAGSDPVKHYLAFGASEGRNPGPLFDSHWYLQQNPDVRNDGTNPLVHYLAHGAAEGRHPSPSSMLTSSKSSDRELFRSQGGADRVVPGGGVGAAGGGHHGSAVGDAGEPLDGVEAELGGQNAKLLASSRFCRPRLVPRPISRCSGGWQRSREALPGIRSIRGKKS